MGAMYIPCPHCGHVTALEPAAEAPASDDVARCPRCNGALRTALPETAIALEADGTQVNSGTTVAVEESGKPDRARSGDPSAAQGNEPAGKDDPDSPAERTAELPAVGARRLPTPLASADPPRRARHAPSFVRRSSATPTVRTRWPWYVAIGVLVLVLTLQLLLVQRQELAASARWRPWIAGLCSALRCEIPPWREPRAFTLLQRSVQPVPGAAGVLAVDANFRNDARWPQPWPTLVLSLSDVEGRQVGIRAFAPSEYRGAGAGAHELLAAGEARTVRFRVREPAPRIVAFTFDFE